MDLANKIMTIYPSLTENDFHPVTGTISLQDDSDGKGPYIAQWNHPTLVKPTKAQLAAV